MATTPTHFRLAAINEDAIKFLIIHYACLGIDEIEDELHYCNFVPRTISTELRLFNICRDRLEDLCKSIKIDYTDAYFAHFTRTITLQARDLECVPSIRRFQRESFVVHTQDTFIFHSLFEQNVRTLDFDIHLRWTDEMPAFVTSMERILRCCGKVGMVRFGLMSIKMGTPGEDGEGEWMKPVEDMVRGVALAKSTQIRVAMVSNFV